MKYQIFVFVKFNIFGCIVHVKRGNLRLYGTVQNGNLEKSWVHLLIILCEKKKFECI